MYTKLVFEICIVLGNKVEIIGWGNEMQQISHNYLRLTITYFPYALSEHHSNYVANGEAEDTTNYLR